MRKAGERVTGGASGRRRQSAVPESAAHGDADAGASLFTPAYRVSHGTQGYAAGARTGYASGPGRAGHPGGAGYGSGYGDRDVSWLGDDATAGFGWTEDDPSAAAWPGGVPGGRGQARRSASNAVRGFPPVPGEPLPVYPPGPFEAWNRVQEKAALSAPSRAGRGGTDPEPNQVASATITPDEFDTDYSLPAIKDPVPGAVVEVDAGRTQPTGSTRTAPPTLPGEPIRRSTATGRPDTGPSKVDRQARSMSGKKRHSHWPAIALAVVIIAAVAGALYYTLPKNNNASPPPAPKQTSTPAPTPTGPTAPPGPWKFIGARKTDAIPLTMKEVFPAKISDGTTTYTRARQAMHKNCHGSVIGSALQAAIHSAGCNQALRATYLSKAAKVMGTIGVFNLKNAAEAGKAAAKAGHSEFVSQLPAKSGPAKAIGQGTGLEEALFKGHYLVLVWVEPTNVSASPSGKNKAKLDTFMNLLVAHTVNASLSYRMVDGKPPPAG